MGTAALLVAAPAFFAGACIILSLWGTLSNRRKERAKINEIYANVTRELTDKSDDAVDEWIRNHPIDTDDWVPTPDQSWEDRKKQW